MVKPGLLELRIKPFMKNACFGVSFSVCLSLNDEANMWSGYGLETILQMKTD